MKKYLSIALVALSALAVSNAFAHDHGGKKHSKLEMVLAAQSDEHKARYDARNPKETLEFFEVKKGDTVLEASPGGGWYTKILAPLLGDEGKLIGVDYNAEIWAIREASEEFLAIRAQWAANWPAKVAEMGVEGGAKIEGAYFGQISEDMNGTVDKVLFIRALHLSARYEDQGGFLSESMADSFRVLKPGGVMGVVQHAAREDRSDDWADGSSGYLKASKVIAMAEAAGFELVDTSDINANELDQAKEGDIVWRLPPSLSTSKEDPELAAKMKAIGESNRMTLKFRKPAA